MKHYAYQRVIRDYNNANNGLNNDLTGTNWEEEVFNAENINEINSNFTNIITSCNKKTYSYQSYYNSSKRQRIQEQFY